MYSTILHPTDLSDSSVPALKAAHQLANKLHSRLVICYIAHPPMIASGTQLTNPKSGETRDIDAEITTIQPPDPKVNRQVQIITIDESNGIKPLLTVLETLDADLMVIGVHKKKGVSSWWGKSISEEVVSTAHCDVLVVKHHEVQDAEGSESA